MTEEQKRIIRKIDSLTFASWGVRDAIRQLSLCCEACGKCDDLNRLKRGCRVAQSYKKLKVIRQSLSEEIDELENPR